MINLRKAFSMVFVLAMVILSTPSSMAAENPSSNQELQNYYNKHYTEEGSCVLVSKNNSAIRIVYSPKLDITVFRDGGNINSVTKDRKIQNIQGRPIAQVEKGYILQMIPVVRRLCKH